MKFTFTIGFMTEKEKETFESVKADLNLYWLPGLWFSHHLREAQKQGRITDSHGAKLIMSVYSNNT
jgi:bestrophin-3